MWNIHPIDNNYLSMSRPDLFQGGGCSREFGHRSWRRLYNRPYYFQSTYVSSAFLKRQISYLFNFNTLIQNGSIQSQRLSYCSLGFQYLYSFHSYSNSDSFQHAFSGQFYPWILRWAIQAFTYKACYSITVKCKSYLLSIT